jgi:hypothetical protein
MMSNGSNNRVFSYRPHLRRKQVGNPRGGRHGNVDVDVAGARRRGAVVRPPVLPIQFSSSSAELYALPLILGSAIAVSTSVSVL